MTTPYDFKIQTGLPDVPLPGIPARLDSALQQLADSITNMYPAKEMSCNEADALSRVLLVAGYRNAAISVLICHAESDIDGDAHYIDDEVDDEDDDALDSDARIAWAKDFLEIED